MKRMLNILLLILLAKICCFSENISPQIPQDSTVLITVSELKYTNLIFVEHKKLILDNKLLQQQINNYKELNIQSEKLDSVRVRQIELYNKQIDSLSKEIKKKNNSIKCWKIGGITVSIGLLIFLLFK